MTIPHTMDTTMTEEDSTSIYGKAFEQVSGGKTALLAGLKIGKSLWVTINQSTGKPKTYTSQDVINALFAEFTESIAAIRDGACEVRCRVVAIMKSTKGSRYSCEMQFKRTALQPAGYAVTEAASAPGDSLYTFSQLHECDGGLTTVLYSMPAAALAVAGDALDLLSGLKVNWAQAIITDTELIWHQKS
jgi:hypothetical protein